MGQSNRLSHAKTDEIVTMVALVSLHCSVILDQGA